MRRCRAVWEVVGTETGSESGREGKRDHPVPEDSQETVIPVSCRGWKRGDAMRRTSIFLVAVAKALKHRLGKGNQIRAVCTPINSS